MQQPPKNSDYPCPWEVVMYSYLFSHDEQDASQDKDSP